MIYEFDVSFTKEEKKAFRDNIIILHDTREQKNDHILKFFEKHKIETVRRKLDFGDYSFMVPGVDQYPEITYENKIVIERKNSLGELASSIGKNRKQFETEFLRAKSKGAKTYLLIENAKLDDIHRGQYDGQYKSKAFLATLRAWENRFDIGIKFVDREFMGKEIFLHFYYYLYELLK